MRTLMAPAMALALAACQTTSGQPTAATVCQSEPVAYAVWQLFRPRAEPQLVQRVEQAHLIVRQFCAAPPNDLATGLAFAIQALTIIQQATP